MKRKKITVTCEKQEHFIACLHNNCIGGLSSCEFCLKLCKTCLKEYGELIGRVD